MNPYQEKAREAWTLLNRGQGVTEDQIIDRISITLHQAYNDGLARGAEIANRISEENGNAYLPSQVADTIREEMKK